MKEMTECEFTPVIDICLFLVPVICNTLRIYRHKNAGRFLCLGPTSIFVEKLCEVTD